MSRYNRLTGGVGAFVLVKHGVAGGWYSLAGVHQLGVGPLIPQHNAKVQNKQIQQILQEHGVKLDDLGKRPR